MRTLGGLYSALSTSLLLRKRPGCSILRAGPLLMLRHPLHLAKTVRAGRHIRQKRSEAEYHTKNVERERGAAVFQQFSEYIFAVLLGAAASLGNRFPGGFQA